MRPKGHLRRHLDRHPVGGTVEVVKHIHKIAKSKLTLGCVHHHTAAALRNQATGDLVPDLHHPGLKVRQIGGERDPYHRVLQYNFLFCGWTDYDSSACPRIHSIELILFEILQV